MQMYTVSIVLDTATLIFTLAAYSQWQAEQAGMKLANRLGGTYVGFTQIAH